MKKPLPCQLEANPPLDLVNVEDTSPPQDIATARQVCAGCPVLVKCRRLVLRTVVAGVAGGMTPDERANYQARHHITPTALDLIDVTPATELTETVLDGLDTTTARLSERVIDVVLRMTAEGLPAEEIGHRVNLAQSTVNYIRRTYAKGAARVEV